MKECHLRAVKDGRMERVKKKRERREKWGNVKKELKR